MTPNDDETDEVPNFPLISSAAFTGTGMSISGSVNTLPLQEVQVNFHLSPTCDPSGQGEGWHQVGSLYTTTAADGTASFDVNAVSRPAVEGRYLTATMVNPLGDTSEFSPCVRALNRGPSLEEIIDAVLGRILDPGDLDLNSDGSVDVGDIVAGVNGAP